MNLCNPAFVVEAPSAKYTLYRINFSAIKKMKLNLCNFIYPILISVSLADIILIILHTYTRSVMSPKNSQLLKMDDYLENEFRGSVSYTIYSKL